MTKPMSAIEIIKSIPEESFPIPGSKDFVLKTFAEHILSFAAIAQKYASLKKDIIKVTESFDASWDKVSKIKEIVSDISADAASKTTA